MLYEGTAVLSVTVWILVDVNVVSHHGLLISMLLLSTYLAMSYVGNSIALSLKVKPITALHFN